MTLSHKWEYSIRQFSRVGADYLTWSQTHWDRICRCNLIQIGSRVATLRRKHTTLTGFGAQTLHALLHISDTVFWVPTEMDDTRKETVRISRHGLTSLSASNYFLWSNEFAFVLRAKRLWQIVTGEEQIPSHATDRAKYERRSDMALTNTIFSIEDSVSAAVITIWDPKKVRELLKEMNVTVSEARMDAYLQKFKNAQVLQEESISLFVNILQDLENMLASTGHVIPDVAIWRSTAHWKEDFRQSGTSLQESSGPLVTLTLSQKISSFLQNLRSVKIKIGTLVSRATLHYT